MGSSVGLNSGGVWTLWPGKDRHLWMWPPGPGVQKPLRSNVVWRDTPWIRSWTLQKSWGLRSYCARKWLQRVIHSQWRRLHSAPSQFYKWLGTEGAPSVEEQQTGNWPNSADHYESAH